MSLDLNNKKQTDLGRSDFRAFQAEGTTNCKFPWARTCMSHFRSRKRRCPMQPSEQGVEWQERCQITSGRGKRFGFHSLNEMGSIGSRYRYRGDYLSLISILSF